MLKNGIQISMDRAGCWRDNVFEERLWRSLKYEEVSLHTYETVREAHQAGVLPTHLQPGQAASRA
jgi:transposase InsO family protein